MTALACAVLSTLRRTLSSLIRRGFARLLEPTATPEPTPHERERERRQRLHDQQQGPARMQIERLAYARPKSREFLDAELDEALTFYGPERVAAALAKRAAKEID